MSLFFYMISFFLSLSNHPFSVQLYLYIFILLFFYSSICYRFILHLLGTYFCVSFGLSVFCRSVLDRAACSLPSLSSVAFFSVLGSRKKRVDAVRDSSLTSACAFGFLSLSWGLSCSLFCFEHSVLLCICLVFRQLWFI